MATAQTEDRPEIIVAPFGIEADHPRNSDLVVQCIPGCKLRSAISGSKHLIDAKTGEPRVPLDQARHLSTFPRTPGMQLHVNPAKLVYTIVDPLNDDEELRERITRWYSQNSAVRSIDTLKGVPTQQGELDTHRMKSLCREMFWLVEAGEAKVVKGALPAFDEIEELPGYFLLNPGSRISNTQPRYEKDFQSWVDRMSRSGG